MLGKKRKGHYFCFLNEQEVSCQYDSHSTGEDVP